MAVKTITIDIEAYDLLSRNKREGQSFSQVITEHFSSNKTGKDLKAVLREARVSEATLTAIDAQVRVHSGLEMAGAVASRLENIKVRGGIKAREVAQLLDTTPETVSRWQTGKSEPQPDMLQRLLTLEWLVGKLAEFYSPDEARLWLFARNRSLGGNRPADWIQQGRIDEVLAVISRLRDGAYV